ncbi:MAG TPA: biotin/lipoyl-containing protein [bacterium]|nr:biotin/lipoyl-containing protein [bacterium]
MKYLLTLSGREVKAEIEAAGPGRYRVKLDGREFALSARRTEGSLYSILLGSLDAQGNVIEGGEAFEADVGEAGEQFGVSIQGESFDIGAIDERRKKLRAAAGSAEGSAGELHSPMPGKLVRFLVKEGATVKRGQGACVVEAMKMENELGAPRDGIVKRLVATEGQPVEGGALLLVIE